MFGALDDASFHCSMIAQYMQKARKGSGLIVCTLQELVCGGTFTIKYKVISNKK